MAISVLIIEDENLAAEKLIRQLNKVDPALRILGTCPSVISSIEFLQKKRPELIFSDIHLSDGLSFEIFNQLELDIPIIFTTAYDQYAIKAFKTNSVDYLLKPITISALENAILKFKKRYHKDGGSIINFAALLQSFKDEKTTEYRQRFLVQQSGSKFKSISVDEIAYFYAEGKHTFLITHENTRHFSDSNITRLTEELDPQYFFQLNRKFIIHIQSISELIHFSKSRLKVILNPSFTEDVIVSSDRSSDFKKWLGK